MSLLSNAQISTLTRRFDQVDEPANPITGDVWIERAAANIMVAEWVYDGSDWVSTTPFIPTAGVQAVVSLSTLRYPGVNCTSSGYGSGIKILEFGVWARSGTAHTGVANFSLPANAITIGNSQPVISASSPTTATLQANTDTLFLVPILPAASKRTWVQSTGIFISVTPAGSPPATSFVLHSKMVIYR